MTYIILWAKKLVVVGFFFFFGSQLTRQNFKQLVILFLVTILFSEFICDWLIIETSNL